MNVTCIKVLEWKRHVRGSAMHHEHGSNKLSLLKYAVNLSSSKGLNQCLHPCQPQRIDDSGLTTIRPGISNSKEPRVV